MDERLFGAKARAIFEAGDEASSVDAVDDLWTNVVSRPVQRARRKCQQAAAAAAVDAEAARRAASALRTVLCVTSTMVWRLAHRLARPLEHFPAILGAPWPPASESSSNDGTSGDQDRSSVCAASAVQACLIVLGDLARYEEQHVRPIVGTVLSDDTLPLSHNLYVAAANVEGIPASGRVFNALAIQCDGLGELYYLCRSAAAPRPFSRARENLMRVLAQMAAPTEDESGTKGGDGVASGREAVVRALSVYLLTLFAGERKRTDACATVFVTTLSRYVDTALTPTDLLRVSAIVLFAQWEVREKELLSGRKELFPRALRVAVETMKVVLSCHFGDEGRASFVLIWLTWLRERVFNGGMVTDETCTRGSYGAAVLETVASMGRVRDEEREEGEGEGRGQQRKGLFPTTQRKREALGGGDVLLLVWRHVAVWGNRAAGALDMDAKVEQEGLRSEEEREMDGFRPIEGEDGRDGRGYGEWSSERSVRIVRIVQRTAQVAQGIRSLRYDSDAHRFVYSAREGNEIETKQMRKMAQQKLLSEVEQLQKSTLERKGGVGTLGTAYGVLDTTALTEHLARVQALVNTQTLIVIVPCAVIADLDTLKGLRGTEMVHLAQSARMAISYLERCFSAGEPHLRAQKQTETVSGSLDIDSCCRYFNALEGGATLVSGNEENETEEEEEEEEEEGDKEKEDEEEEEKEEEEGTVWSDESASESDEEESYAVTFIGRLVKRTRHNAKRKKRR